MKSEVARAIIFALTGINLVFHICYDYSAFFTYIDVGV